MPGPHAGKHKSLDFSIKQEVIKRKEESQDNSAIGRALGLSESTVRAIWKNKMTSRRLSKHMELLKLMIAIVPGMRN